MKSVITIIICIILVSTQACYYDKAELLYPSSGCDTTNVTYSQAVKPIVNAYCISCHSSGANNSLGGAINLETYSNILVQVQNGKLLKAIQHEEGASPMPKNQQKLSQCNITKIEKWINSGALNN